MTPLALLTLACRTAPSDPCEGVVLTGDLVEQTCREGRATARVTGIGSLTVSGPEGATLDLTLEAWRLERLTVGGASREVEELPCDWGVLPTCQRWAGTVTLPVEVSWIDAWR